MNARPRRSRTVGAPPQLRLIRGRGPALRLAASRRPPLAKAKPRASASRAGQLIFVLAMAGIGLAALATSVGQLVTRAM